MIPILPGRGLGSAHPEGEIHIVDDATWVKCPGTYRCINITMSWLTSPSGNDDADDEDVPPLNAAVGALGGVAVGALADDDVRLFVLDLGEEFGEFADCKERGEKKVLAKTPTVFLPSCH